MQIANLIYIKTCLILIFFIKAHTDLYHYINQFFIQKSIMFVLFYQMNFITYIKTGILEKIIEYHLLIQLNIKKKMTLIK